MLHRFMFSAMLALGASTLVLACSGNVVTNGHDTSAKPDSTSLPATGSPPPPPASPPVIGSIELTCVAADDACEVGGDPCCAGLYCADSGYGYGFCRPPEPNGAFCQDAAACQSGICHQYTCVEEIPACVGLGQYCADGAPCCEGWCTPLSYAPESGTCAPPQEAGSSCTDGIECQSGICDLYLCRASECSAAGAECIDDAGCCGGFCSGGPYAPGECTAPLPAGSFCETWLWCASFQCVDSVCAP